MEAKTQENINSYPESSKKVQPKRGPPRVKGKKTAAPAPPFLKPVIPAPEPPFPKPVIPEPPKINPTTFPVITSRILLKTDVPPAAVPKINQADFDQNLCSLCLDKTDSKKRVYHMYFSNEKEMERDTERMRKIYENRKDLKIVDRMVLPTLCARSLGHRIQNKLTDVAWNKQKTIFETDIIGERDIYKLSGRMYHLQYEELAKLFNYIKFLSTTNS